MSAAGKIQAPRGTSDVLGEQAAARAVIEERARALLEDAGYERIETPTFEATELFARGVGASTDIVQKEMYTFEDASGRSLTLRPEGTAPVCRAYVEHGMHKRRQPVKLWYCSSFYRHERAQAGRYRQFWQVGAEALGSEDPALDAESIGLLVRLLEELGVARARLRLSSLGGHAARQEYRARLSEHLRAHEERLSEDVSARIEQNPLRAFDSEHPGTREVMQTAPLLLEHLDAQDVAHFAEVRARLDAAGIAYDIDPTLVRGLDYYTRTVFELTSEELGAQSGVGGGGRYDGLVHELGGPPTAGMGWAAGIERILLAGAVTPPAHAPVDLFVAYERAPKADTARAGEPGGPTGGPGGRASEAGESAGGPGGRAGGPGDSAGGPGGRTGGQDAAEEYAPVGAYALLSQARAAGLRARMELAGRSLKNQLGYANTLQSRYVAILGQEDGRAALRDMSEGTQQTLGADEVVHAVLRGLRTL